MAQDINTFSEAYILAEEKDINRIHFPIISLITMVMRAIKQCGVLREPRNPEPGDGAGLGHLESIGGNKLPRAECLVVKVTLGK